jgi:hypothetical protein
MPIYAWWPESYGEWAFVQADNAEDAKKALAATESTDSGWSVDYHNRRIAEFLTREPEEIKPGDVTFGEFA